MLVESRALCMNMLRSSKFFFDIVLNDKLIRWHKDSHILSSNVPATSPLYLDASAPIPQRVSDLLSRMTLEEKAAQLGYGGSCSSDITRRHPLGVGGLGATDIACSNQAQQELKNKTRLGIPVSFLAETTHSGGAPGTTVFPMSVLQCDHAFAINMDYALPFARSMIECNFITF